MPKFKSFEEFILFMEDYELPPQTPSTTHPQQVLGSADCQKAK